MIRHIAKRELYANLNSLRFALTTVLLLSLMLTNAIVYLREHPARIQRYLTSVSDARNALETRADSLYELAQKGPGTLYKKPSPLYFCAEAGEPFLSSTVEANHRFWDSRPLKSFWRMMYPAATPNLTNLRPNVTKVDWAFIIGYILSLISLLFTYDSIAGEREHGTLRLILTNPISRHTVLIGKFLGALLSISIPFALSVLMNLLLISLSRVVHLGPDAWCRLGIILGIAFVYTSLFLVLGLFVSTRVQQSAVSLVILLLTWVTFVVFIPRVFPVIVSDFSSSMSFDELSVRRRQIHEKLWKEYISTLGVSELRDIQAGSRLVTRDQSEQQGLIEERLNKQIAQIQQALTIICISPTAILQYLLESFSGTGFQRHLQFLENTKQYAREYQEFIVNTDRADPQSFHFIGVRAGMSKKPVSPKAIPKFEDTFSLSQDFNTSVTRLLLLTLFVGLLFSGAYLVFVRIEV